MKAYRAILFDLDATITNVEQEDYLNSYFGVLGNAFKDYPGGPMAFIKGVVAGVEAMKANDGSVTNYETFWDAFTKATGMTEESSGERFMEFYKNDFKYSGSIVKPNPLVVEAVKTAREKAEFVCLATDPVFPMIAQVERASWMGLKAEDFDIITDYETYRSCKPSQSYYLEICEKLGVKPEECLMIGNDEREDMLGATRVGMDAYLVTDHIIEREECPWNGPRGSFEEMVQMLKAL